MKSNRYFLHLWLRKIFESEKGVKRVTLSSSGTPFWAIFTYVSSLPPFICFSRWICLKQVLPVLPRTTISQINVAEAEMFLNQYFVWRYTIVSCKLSQNNNSFPKNCFTVSFFTHFIHLKNVRLPKKSII